jgi:prepilin-type N-terminal cleavage/methylation domain-containing protein
MPMIFRRQQAGVSLVELMVALLLLGVALLGLAAAFAPGRMAIQGGDQSTTATFLARKALEDMRNRAYDLDSDELVNGTDFPATTAYGSVTYGSVAYPNFRRTITFADDSPEVGTKTVTVAVFYRDSGGVERPVTLTMIFTRGS